MSMTRTVLAELDLVFSRSGLRVRGTIAIHVPYVVDDAEARCEVEVRAPKVMQERAAISGGDTLQALLLAIRYLGARLTDFRRKGGQIAAVAGEEFPLDAYFGELTLAALPPPTTTIWIRTRRRRRRARR